MKNFTIWSFIAFIAPSDVVGYLGLSTEWRVSHTSDLIDIQLTTGAFDSLSRLLYIKIDDHSLNL